MNRISANILYSGFGELLLFGLSFLLSVITAWYLGAAGRGRFWILYNAAGLLIIIFSMRFSSSITFHLSKNKERVGEAILYALFVGLAAVFCVALVANLFSGFLYNILLKEISTEWPVLVLICFSYYLWTLIIAVIEGLMLFHAKAIFMGASHFIKLLSVIYAVGVLNLEFDGLILFMGAAETIVYSMIILFFLFRANHFRVNGREFHAMLKYSAGSFPGAISNFYTLRIDGFFLNYFSGPAEVGVYSIASSLIMMILYVPAAIRNVLMPYIASSADRAITPKLSRLLIMAMALLSLSLIPLVWVSVIPIYGVEFHFSRDLFLLLLPGSIFWGVFLLISSDIDGRGFPFRVSRVLIASAFTTVGMGLVLIPLWNAAGAAIVCSLSHALTMTLIIRVYNRMVEGNFSQLLIPKQEDIYRFMKIAHDCADNLREGFTLKFWAKKPGI